MYRVLFACLFSLLVTTVIAQQDTVSTAVDPTFTQPRFPGCEEREMNDKFKYLCSQKRFVNFLDKRIDYPKLASQNGIKGKVIVSFVVEADGSITKPKIVREPGAGLGQAVLDAIEEMQREKDLFWRPAYLADAAVASKVEVPIEFALGYKSLKAKKPTTYIIIPDIMPSAPIGIDSAVPTDKDMDTNDKVYDESHVEFAAYFKGCDGEMSLLERYKCSRDSYFAYVKDQIEYPQRAKSLRIQGVASVGAIIEKDGSLSNLKLLRDPGTGLGQEALRIVTAMKDSTELWTPAKVGGEAVRSSIDLPIMFRLVADDIAPLLVITDRKKKTLYDCTRLSDLSVLKKIDGIKIKEIKEKKARADYAEKGRYGAYKVRLPKGKGKLPGALKRLEEVESYEMYYKGLLIEQTDDALILDFEEVTAAGEVILHNWNGRSLQNAALTIGSPNQVMIDTNEVRSGIYLVSITQNGLRHSYIIEL